MPAFGNVNVYVFGTVPNQVPESRTPELVVVAAVADVIEVPPTGDGS